MPTGPGRHSLWPVEPFPSLARNERSSSCHRESALELAMAMTDRERSANDDLGPGSDLEYFRTRGSRSIDYM